MKQRIAMEQEKIKAEKEHYLELMNKCDEATLELENARAEIRKLKRK